MQTKTTTSSQATFGGGPGGGTDGFPFHFHNRLGASAGREFSSDTLPGTTTVRQMIASATRSLLPAQAADGVQTTCTVCYYPTPGQPGREIQQDDPQVMDQPISSMFHSDQVNVLGLSPIPRAGRRTGRAG